MIDAYKIGVSIAMTNGVSAILAVIQRDILGLHKAVEMTNGGFSRMKLAVVGLAGVTLGAGMLAGLYELSKAGEKYTHQLELMKIAGMSAADMKLAIAAADQTSSQVRTSSPTSNLQVIGELRSVFGDTKEAIHFLPQMQRLSAIFSSITGGAPEKLGYTTMRAVEMMGGTVDPKSGQMDVDRASRMVDLITQATIASHGKVGPQEWLQFAQQASGVVKKMDTSALILGMMPIIQEMGGFRAGTALTSMNQQIVGGVMPQRVVADWEKYGLINMDKVTPTKTGVRVGVGGIVGEETWKKNPLEWIESVFIPKLHAQGVKDEDISDQIIRLFSRQTSQREASLMATQLVRIHKDVAMAQQAATSAPGANELLRNNPKTVRAALDVQAGRLATDLGRALTPTVVAAMQGLTKAFAYLSEVIEAHPTATKWVLGIAAGLAAVLIVAGTVAIAVAAIAAIGTVGWIAAGVTAVGIAIAAVGVAIAANWDRIKSFGSMIGEALSSLTTTIWNWIKSPFGGKPAEMPADWKPANVGAPGSLSQRLHDSPAFQSSMAGLRGGIANDLRESVAPSAANSNTSDDEATAKWRSINAAHDAEWAGLKSRNILNQPTISNDEFASKFGEAVKNAMSGLSVQMDGRVVGQLVASRLGDESYKPPSGTSIFDTRQSPSFANFPGR